MSEGIKILTRDEVVKAAPAKWAETYGFKDDRFKIGGKSKPEITKELLALQPHELTAERVNSIIGNKSWTELECAECREDVAIVAGVGEDIEWGGKSVNLCRKCLSDALVAIDAAHQASLEGEGR